MSLKRTNTVLDLFSTADSLQPYLQEVPKQRFFSYTSVQDSARGEKDMPKIAQEIASDYSAFNSSLLTFSGILLDIKDTSVLQRLEEVYEKQRKKDVLAYLIATHYQKRHKDEKAMEWIGKAIIINPYVEAYLVLQSRLFTALKKNKEAIENLERITTFSKEPWHYYYMAYLLNRVSNQNQQASVSLDSAIASLKKIQQKKNITPADSFDIEKQGSIYELKGYEKEREDLLTLSKKQVSTPN